MQPGSWGRRPAPLFVTTGGLAAPFVVGAAVFSAGAVVVALTGPGRVRPPA